MAPQRLSIALVLALVTGLLVAAPALADHGDAHSCFDQVVNVEGTSGDDSIDLGDGTHGAGPFVVATFGGNDVVIGSSGADVVCLGDGNDRFRGLGGDDLGSGGNGNDNLKGNAGNDVLYGDDGNDVLRGQADSDELHGGGGDDVLFGGSGVDSMYGDAGMDDMRGGRGSDSMFGGPDDDTMSGRAGNDLMDGEAGNDFITGNGGQDDIDGGLGNDTIRGGPGHDLLDGDDMPSIIGGSPGADDIYGGSGNDRIYANWTFSDNDTTGTVHGGKDFDACAFGQTVIACERLERNSSQASEEWRPTVEEVFGRWGLTTEACGTINGAEHCVGGQVDYAIKVINCESSGWPWALHTGSQASGLFQNLAGFWNTRVNSAISYAASKGITTTLSSGAYIFDPVANAEVAAYLVHQSRATLIGDALFGTGPYPDNWNPGTDPVNDSFDNYAFPHYHSGWQKGPNPWGHWTCGDDVGVDAWDPAWIHPNANPQP